ncbi:hypothetical protein M2419_003479 [Sphingobacterium sp. BIGb0116]|nr:hypothetical protein [Sphingobacterium sp. BIGb0116]
MLPRDIVCRNSYIYFYFKGNPDIETKHRLAGQAAMSAGR